MSFGVTIAGSRCFVERSFAPGDRLAMSSLPLSNCGIPDGKLRPRSAGSAPGDTVDQL
jgi:hypothetical protein